MSDPNGAIPPQPTPGNPPQPGYGAPQQPPAPGYGAPQQPQAPQQPPAPGYGAPQQPPAPGYGAAPQGQPQYQQAPSGAVPYTADQDKNMAMWSHFGGIIGPLPPLLIWLICKDRGPRTNVEGKESLNWQITFIIIQIAWSIVIGIISGIVVASAITSGNSGALGLASTLGLLAYIPWIANLVFCIMGGVKVNGGGSYRYPVNFRFIK